MTLTQFIILETTEVLAILGYAVYLELIELRFWDLDKDLKRNIIERGFRETPLKPMEMSFEENKDCINDSFLDLEQNSTINKEINDSTEF